MLVRFLLWNKNTIKWTSFLYLAKLYLLLETQFKSSLLGIKPAQSEQSHLSLHTNYYCNESHNTLRLLTVNKKSARHFSAKWVCSEARTCNPVHRIKLDNKKRKLFYSGDRKLGRAVKVSAAVLCTKCRAREFPVRATLLHFRWSFRSLIF